MHIGVLGLKPPTFRPAIIEVDAVSNRLIRIPSAASFLCSCGGPVSINSFVGTNPGIAEFATKATGALWVLGVTGFNEIDGET